VPTDATTTVGVFLVALKTALAARYQGSSGLQTVKTFLVAPAEDEQKKGDLVVLVAGKIVEEDELATATRTRSRDQIVKIPGVVQAYEVAREGGDAAFQKAMDRAALILDELVFQLRDAAPSVGRQTRSALVSKVVWTPIPVDDGGWAVRGDFVINYSTRVS
jgi:hypothetical protein